MESPFLQALCDWCSDATEIHDESPIESGQSMDTPHLGHCLRGRPILNDFNFLLTYLNPLGTHIKTHK